jgi:hypothetical protein
MVDDSELDDFLRATVNSLTVHRAGGEKSRWNVRNDVISECI